METEAKYKVFLVDDDTFLLNMYSVKLSKNGFEVNTALSGQEAIKKIKAGYEPDIMLLDVIMPGMDGLKVLEDIRREHLVPNATIVMLTNQSDSGDIEKAKALGMDGYIVKATTIPSEVIKSVLEIHHNKHKQ
jgi:CheY-like chemotaxis protein